MNYLVSAAWRLYFCATVFISVFPSAVSDQPPTVRDVSVAVGQTATLPCSIDTGGASDSSVTAAWYSPSEEMLTMNYTVNKLDDRLTVLVGYQRERNLRLRDVRTDDVGTYTCKMVPGNRILAQVRLVVKVPPKITTSSPDVTAPLDSDVTLTCAATGSPMPEITWNKLVGGEAEKTVVGKGETLRLTSVKRDNAGSYLCEADNGVLPPASVKIIVKVLFDPQLALPYRELRQAPGTDALLTCMVQSNPPADVKWFRSRDDYQLTDISSGKYRVQSWSVGDDTVLLGAYIVRLESTDYGAYRCVATSQHTEHGRQTEAVVAVLELNGTGPPLLPAMDCEQAVASADSMVAAVAALAVLLVAAILGLAAALYALQRTRRLTQNQQQQQKLHFQRCSDRGDAKRPDVEPSLSDSSVRPSTAVDDPKVDEEDSSTAMRAKQAEAVTTSRFNSSKKCTRM